MNAVDSAPTDELIRQSPHQNRSTALAIQVSQGKLGCVVFNEDEHELFLCEDQPFDLDVPDSEAGEHAYPNHPESDSLGILGSREYTTFSLQQT